jgi:sulfonate transport system substrate-binding protein
MSMLRKAAVWAAGLLLTVSALSGCVSRQQNSGTDAVPAAVPLSELSGVTLQVGDQKGGTESLLRAANALDALPYRIVFSTFTSGPPQIEAATAGRIDFAITGNTPPIFGAAANAKVKVVSAYDGSGRGDKVLVHDDSPIRAVTDLRGKRIAVAKGSSAHGNILAQLHRVGLAPEDVQLVFLQPADALGAFTQRQVDAWAIWDPYTAQAEADIAVRSIADATGVTNGAGFGIASQEALADPKRNSALSDLLVRYAKATRWAADNPDKWAQSYSAAVGLDPKVSAVSQGRSLRLPVPLSDRLIASEQELTDLFAKSKQIDGMPEFKKWVADRYDGALKSLYLVRN